jgi:hypothetical protein
LLTRLGQFVGALARPEALVLCLWLAFGATVVGCQAYPIHANMTDDEAAAVLAQRFGPGMSSVACESVLDDLRVAPKRRTWYESSGARGPVLLARVTEPGGFWPDGEDSIVEFIDVSLVFGASNEANVAGLLHEVRMRRGGIRYFRGEPAQQPLGADGEPRLMGRVGRFPLEPGPPRDPVAETRLVVGGAGAS